MLFPFFCISQETHLFKDISVGWIYTTDTPMVIDQIDLFAPTYGTVVATIDGQIQFTLGDRKYLAISHDTTIRGGYFSTSVEVPNGTLTTQPYCHTRVFLVGPGKHTFYMLAMDSVELDGNGRTYVYGNISLSYYPTLDGLPAVDYQYIDTSGMDLRTDLAVLAENELTVAVPGTIVTRLTGYCVLDTGDLVLVAANDSMQFDTGSASIPLKAFNQDADRRQFSHTHRVDVGPGTHTLYGIAQNLYEQNGSGEADIFGVLTSVFYPDTPYAPLTWQGIIDSTDVDCRGADVVLRKITIQPTVAGTVHLTFDGYGIPDIGDRIIVAANRVPVWQSGFQSVQLQADDPDIDKVPYSHSRTFLVNPGTHHYYAVAENWVNENGSGIADFHGRLTVRFFPDCIPKWVIDAYIAAAEDRTFYAHQFILAKNQVDSAAILRLFAADSVRLDPGFHSKKGSILEVDNVGCP